MTGLAQTAAEHLDAIERVIAEQVIDPEPAGPQRRPATDGEG